MKHNHKYYAYYRFYSFEQNDFIERIECIYSVKEFKKRIQHLKFVTTYIQKVW